MALQTTGVGKQTLQILPRSRKPTRGQGFRQRPRTTACRILIRRQSDLNLSSQPKCIIEVKMTPGLGLNAVHSDVLHVGGYSRRYGMLNRTLVEVLHGDRRTRV